MHIRRAMTLDWPAIVEFLNKQDYFMPVNPATLGGEWFIAVDAADRVRGTIWFFAAGQNAYIDYWAATSAKTASNLAAVLDAVLKVAGVKYARAVIASTNTNARRLATEGFGMVESDADYKLVFRSF